MRRLPFPDGVEALAKHTNRTNRRIESNLRDRWARLEFVMGLERGKKGNRR
jgi:hypothetical protein